MKKYPWIVAHRGARKEAPDNTMAAFEKALTYPIHGIELDVQMTEDGVPVIFHDRTIKKICGKAKPISRFSLDELNLMDWGLWYGFGFSGEPLPTLDRVLKNLSLRTSLMIEVKSFPADRSSGRIDLLASKVVREITTTAKAHIESLYVLSFDPRVLDLVNRTAPEIKTVLNLSENKKDPTSPWNFIKTCQNYTDCHALCVKGKNLSQELMDCALKEKMKVMIYSCNTTRQAMRAIAMGVNVIITDRPDILAVP